MMACANASNILGEATSASGNTSIEAMRGGENGLRLSVRQAITKKKSITMRSRLNQTWLVAFAGCIAAFSSHAAPLCPITVSSNSGTSVNDAATANCVVTINDGKTLSTASDSVTVSGAGSTVTNNGTITSTGGYGIYSSGASVGTITNTGTINTSGSSGIINTNAVTTINNSGTITSTSSNGFNNYSGTVTNVINTGTMTGGATGSGVSNGAMTLGTTITNFTNNGALVGSGSGYGVRNDVTYGSIGTFNNGQGGNSSAQRPQHWSITESCPRTTTSS